MKKDDEHLRMMNFQSFIIYAKSFLFVSYSLRYINLEVKIKTHKKNNINSWTKCNI